MARFLTIGMAASTLLVSGMTDASVSGPWMAFRYSATKVLCYVGQAKDLTGFTGPELTSKQLPQPAARWGGGGYLMPLAAGRFSALQADPGTKSALRRLGRGEILTVLLGPEETLQATVEGFVEQWGGENPQVQIGVLVRINADGLTRFQSNRDDYFLAYGGGMPSTLPAQSHQEIVGPRQVLNSFGPIGELVVVKGDEGWNVTLWRRFSGKLKPTDVTYSYGD